MGKSSYRLSCTVEAHSSDIRAVTIYHPVKGIITGSRDKTVKVWSPDAKGRGFVEAHSMHGPTKFISCVCALPPSDQYPRGLILAGSIDCAIYGFSLDSPEPVLKLHGHSENVCALAAGNIGTVVSGSWDKTARVWCGQRCVAKLTGHSQAVWAVSLLPEHGLVLTGSADNTIGLWRGENCERRFIGHEDCVRGLAVISNSEFLSCSNDATIRRWQANGDCIGVYSGHTDYIYDICISPCGEYFVTCSEDQTVKVWKDNLCVDTIAVPAKSLWGVTYLENSDIAVGASDGTLRVFTTDAERRASGEEENLFHFEILKMALEDSKGNIEDLKVNGIPDSVSLLSDGRYDGENRFCKSENDICVFRWSSIEKKWNKLGRAIDTLEGKRGTKKKTVYDGKEYDHVFTIDVAEEKFLKLPYNACDDPWQVANAFIEEHDLNPMFLDQIASFIINNSKPDGLLQNVEKLSDPFTGTNGESSTKTESETYFPLLSYVTFDIANFNGIKAKLYEFVEKVEKSQKLTAEEIENMLLLSKFPDEITDLQMESLEKALNWPTDLVFPALDVLRLAVRAEPVNCRVSKDGGVSLINHLLKHLSNDTPVANQMLVLRALSNFFVHSPGEHLLIEHAKKILNVSKSCLTSGNKHVQIGLATLYLNYAVAFLKSPDPEYVETFLTDAAEALKHLKEPEALFRLLICVGTSVQNKSCHQAAVTMNLAEVVRSVIESTDVPKIKNSGDSLISLIAS